MENPVVIFVCEHGAAKSILAAAYFNHLATQRGMHVTAVARGTNPDPSLSEQTLNGLLKDGLKPTQTLPQKLSLDDVQSAGRIVSFCELADEFREKVVVEQWEGIPAVSEEYERARDAILNRINHLLDNLRSSS